MRCHPHSVYSPSLSGSSCYCVRSLREAVNNEEMDGRLLVTLAVDFLLLSSSPCAASITPVTAELFRSAELRARRPPDQFLLL
jgi:hypothetical protein